MPRGSSKKLFLFGLPGGGMGSTAFVPSQLTGYYLDYDPATLALADGTAVASWTDKASGVAATQATGLKQPTYKTNIINTTKPVVRFAGGQGLATAALNLTTQSAVTVFAVFNSTVASSDQIVLETSANYTSNNGAFVVYRDSGNHLQSSAKGDVDYSTHTGVTTVSSTYVLSSTVIDLSKAGQEVTQWLNGVLEGYRNLDRDNTTSNLGNFAFNIGARGNATSLYLTGDIARLIVYKGALSNSQRKQVEGYLNTAYNIYTSGLLTYEIQNTDLYDNPSFISWPYAPFSQARFTTDATSLTAQVYCYNFAGVTSSLAKVGVRVNGADYATLTCTGEGVNSLTTSLPTGSNKTVELVNGGEVLNSTIGHVSVRSVSFDAAATLATPSSGTKLLVYGDSIAQGQNATTPAFSGWPVQLRGYYSGNILNEGYGGRSLNDDGSSAALRASFARKLAGFSPSIVWLAIGVNDYILNKWTAAAFGTAYADLLDQIHTQLPSATIYAQTPIVRTTETANGSGNTLGDYRTQIATAQSTRSSYCTLVDGTAILTTGDLADGTHPTTAGHAKYASYVRTVLGISSAPAVTYVTPSTGPNNTNTSITIGGTGFVTGCTVQMGSVTLTGVTFVSSRTLTVTVPPGFQNTAQSITVTNPDAQAGTLNSAFTPSGSTIYLADHFNRADNAASAGSLDIGGAWTAAQGTWGISSNQLKNFTAGQGIIVADAAHADGTWQIDINTEAFTYGAFRYSDNNNLWIAGISGGNLKLFKIVASSTIQVGSSIPLSAPNTVRGVLSGNSIQIYSVTSAGVATLQLSTTDSFNATATKFGAWDGTSGHLYDNFFVSA